MASLWLLLIYKGGMRAARLHHGQRHPVPRNFRSQPKPKRVTWCPPVIRSIQDASGSERPSVSSETDRDHWGLRLKLPGELLKFMNFDAKWCKVYSLLQKKVNIGQSCRSRPKAPKEHSTSLGGAPPVISWFIIPLATDISTINPSYY